MEGDCQIDSEFTISFKVKPIEEIFAKRGLEDHGRVQKYIDSEVIRLMAPYTPKLQGVLIETATELTDIGSGEVRQGGAKAPYARKWYEYEDEPGSKGVNWTGGAPRGSYWFERMKQNGGKESILKGAEREAGIK